ncbi:MAG: phosphoribosylaminoimidazolesuccinocarboxamide synthase [Thermodesulfobacteriota bacterium]
MTALMYAPAGASRVLIRRGKVRDVFATPSSEHLAIVASDRISAFDCILPTPIPQKGVVLTKMANFWFAKTRHIVANHCAESAQAALEWVSDEFKERTTFVKKAEPLPVEAIVRGYLSGSALKEYRKTGTVCGIRLPAGLRESVRLHCPIYTPSTKAMIGANDENIDFEQTVALLGRDLAEQVRDVSLKLYCFAADYAWSRGVIIADTKFEFGLVNGELTLIDEVLTPDSSRFWPLASYMPGRSQSSFDKQYVRDYLAGLGWDKTLPAPVLPPEVVAKTAEKYREALVRLTASLN